MRDTVWRSREGFPRTLLLLASFLVLATMLFLQSAPPLRADSISEKKEQARRVEQQLNSLQAELNRLTSELSQTQSRLAAVQAKIEANQARMQQAEGEYRRWQGILSDRVVAMYKEGNTSALDVLLECDDFETFLNSYSYMSRIGDHDAEAIEATQKLMAEIRARRAELENARAEYQAYSNDLKTKRSAVQSKLNEQKAILAGIDAEVASLLSTRYGGGGGRSGGGRGGGGWNVGPVNGLYFPVAGPHSYVNDWGAPRSVGRTHKGCDIMADYGTPCVAITSGTVVQRRGGNAGLYVFLYGDNGHLYYYMHLQSYGASGRVAAGEVIGYVGDTGNARGCPHLHFEWHPNGGAAVNPYPLLVAIDR